MELRGIPCIDLETEETKRKSCCVSRSFGKKVESLDKWIEKFQIQEIYLPYVTKGNWKKIYKKIITKYPSINFIILKSR